MKKLVLLGAAALIAAAAAGCGRMADLEAPPARETERSQRDARAPGLPEPASCPSLLTTIPCFPP